MRHRRVLYAIANIAFSAAILGSACLLFVSLVSGGWYVIISLLSCIPIILLSVWRDTIVNSYKSDQLDLFDWIDGKQAEAAELARQEFLKKYEVEYREYLKKNPDLAAYEKLPLNAKIRAGLVP